ncbi:hypothetical protein JXE04_01305 [Patescibacteria group bacterium]|nr:hypothetical protein [Patescibacteria group bacterium]
MNGIYNPSVGSNFLFNNPDSSNKEEFEKLEKKWQTIETLNVPGVRLAVSGSNAWQTFSHPHFDSPEDHIPLSWSPTVAKQTLWWW